MKSRGSRITVYHLCALLFVCAAVLGVHAKQHDNPTHYMPRTSAVQG